MSTNLRNILLFTIMGALLVAVGVIQSANVALAILNLCLISAIMTLGVNIQWGYAGPLHRCIAKRCDGWEVPEWCPHRGYPGEGPRRARTQRTEAGGVRGFGGHHY